MDDLIQKINNYIFDYTQNPSNIFPFSRDMAYITFIEYPKIEIDNAIDILIDEGKIKSFGFHNWLDINKD